jgi:FKBP-type peptidyl-prolyl cis-trans isomerase
VRIPQDSFYRRQPQEMRKGVKAGDPVIYNVGVSTIKTAAQFKKEQEDYKKQMAQMTKMQAEMKKQQAAQAKQALAQKALIKTQDADIKKYLAANNITNATKTETGLYIAVDKQGEGALPKKGSKLTMNYDGKLLDGTKFDSNIDSAFNHVTPFSFKLGQGQVIQGWDQGLQQFKVGSKGRLIIPSALAYGPNAQGKIPANSVLDFAVEVLDMQDSATVAAEDALKAKEASDKAAADRAAADKTAAEQETTILEYLKTNNLRCQRSNSGLHVLINNAGTGASPSVGDDVTMNYTGMFLDGKKFDSNVDSAFGHVSPFNFPLGQGRVIKGWDEGVAMLKKGGKATFIIPSALAYGAGGSGSIPANSILRFDVELVDFKKAASPTNQPGTKTINVGGKK